MLVMYYLKLLSPWLNRKQSFNLSPFDYQGAFYYSYSGRITELCELRS